jgi:hypothetical protein
MEPSNADEFLKDLKQKWEGISESDEINAICAYFAALRSGMPVSSGQKLADFISRAKIPNAYLGLYFAKYGDLAFSICPVLNSLSKYVKDLNPNLSFLMEKPNWTYGEVEERLTRYSEELSRRISKWRQEGYGRSHSATASAQVEHDEAGATQPRSDQINRYFYELIKLKGPGFTEKVQSVSARASQLGVRGIMPFISGYATSLGLNEENLVLAYEGHARPGGKEFPDILIEILSRAEVDDYVVAYSYVLISEWVKRNQNRQA